VVLSLRGIASDIGRSFFNPLKSENSISEAVGCDSSEACDSVEIAPPVYRDKFYVGHNPAVDAVTDSIYDELRAGRAVRLMTHTQDETEMNRALQDVKNRLMLEDRLTPREAENLMNKIRIETFQHGAAA